MRLQTKPSGADTLQMPTLSSLHESISQFTAAPARRSPKITQLMPAAKSCLGPPEKPWSRNNCSCLTCGHYLTCIYGSIHHKKEKSLWEKNLLKWYKIPKVEKNVRNWNLFYHYLQDSLRDCCGRTLWIGFYVNHSCEVSWVVLFTEVLCIAELWKEWNRVPLAVFTLKNY